jgi:hypothetical protein
MYIKFFELDKTARQTYRLLKLVFREETMSRTQTHDWFSKYRRGLMLVNSAEYSGCPSSSEMDENVVQIMLKYSHISFEHVDRLLQNLCLI